MKKISNIYWSMVCTLVLQLGCGVWVGNPTEGGEEEGDKKTESTASTPTIPGTTSPSSGTGAASIILKPGDVLFQKLKITKGTKVQSAFDLEKKLSLTEDVEEDSAIHWDLADPISQDTAGPLEIQVLGSKGVEEQYQRKEPTNAKIEWTPTADGEVEVAMKNNSTSALEVKAATVEGATAAAPEAANARVDAIYKDYVLKAVIVFARQCKAYSNGGLSTATVNAPKGEYFVQPFVFLGKVDKEKKVSLINSAKIQVKYKDKAVKLSTLADFDFSVFKSQGGLTKDQHITYTRAFYQGYFSTAGEMYTVDTFWFGGDCSKATTFALESDVGKSQVTLEVEDTTITPKLSESLIIRPTLGVAFSTYDREGVKRSDWTQCTYDRITGKTKTYNGSATECQKISTKNSPYVTLDYLMPSGQDPKTYTEASDPSRIIFYGHSLPQSWYPTLVKDAEILGTGLKSTVTLDRCLNNGGMVSVPISKGKAYMPLQEFNTALGDVVSLARRPGSYTALGKFYQGNVDGSGSISIQTCLVKGLDSCFWTKTIEVKSSSCTIKADSSITTTAISDSFIYPEYFEMSGEITE